MLSAGHKSLCYVTVLLRKLLSTYIFQEISSYVLLCWDTDGNYSKYRVARTLASAIADTQNTSFLVSQGEHLQEKPILRSGWCFLLFVFCSFSSFCQKWWKNVENVHIACNFQVQLPYF